MIEALKKRILLAEFVKYFNEFYGKKGIYPNEKDFTFKQISKAVDTLEDFCGDSFDRERVRDILVK